MMQENHLFITVDDLMSSYRKALQRTFWLVAVLTIGTFFYTASHPAMEVRFACFGVALFALLPFWLWCTRRVVGLPIIPGLALIDLIFIVLPILDYRATVREYSPGAHLATLFAQWLFLGVMTAAWYRIASRPAPLPRRILMLDPRKGTSGFYQQCALLILLVVNVYLVLDNSGFIYRHVYMRIGGGWRNPVNSVISILSFLATFVLSLSLGQRALSTFMSILSVTLISTSMLLASSNLILNTITVQFCAWLGGFVLGRGRIPWVALLIFLSVVNVLHIGKWEMRRKYWEIFDGVSRPLTLVDYPSFYAEWMGHGIAGLNRPANQERSDRTNILERTSSADMLLYAQRYVPAHHPFLYGRTYAVIPELLIPRILHPNKPRAHQGQVILNVELGRQTLNQTMTTYIAWGMLAESWANFGWLGPVLLGLFLGGLGGYISSISAYAPLASYRFAVATICCLLGLNSTQNVASIIFTTFFQAIIVISALCLLVMGMRPSSLLEQDQPGELPEEEPVLYPEPAAARS